MNVFTQDLWDHIITLLAAARGLFATLKERLDSIDYQSSHLYTWINRQINKFKITGSQNDPYIETIEIDRQECIKQHQIEVLKHIESIKNQGSIPYRYNIDNKSNYIDSDTFIWGNSSLSIANEIEKDMTLSNTFMNGEGKMYSGTFTTTGIKIEKIEVS